MAEWLSDRTLQSLLLGSGGVLVWALALYVGSRAPGRRAAILAAGAMLCLAVYLAGEALGALAAEPVDWSGWLRRTWWAPCLALPAWLGVTLVLAADEGPSPLAQLAARWFRPLLVITVAIGAFFGAVGSLTILVQNWEAPVTAGATRHHPAGPLLLPFQVFAL